MINLKNGNPPGVIIPLEWMDMLTSLPLEEAGEVLLAILTYGATGALPEFGNRALQLIWPLFQSRLDADRERYRKKVERSQAAAERREQERREKSEQRTAAHSRTAPRATQDAALDKWL